MVIFSSHSAPYKTCIVDTARSNEEMYRITRYINSFDEISGFHGSEYEDGCLLALRRVVWQKLPIVSGVLPAPIIRTVMDAFKTAS
jgi:hypothetical protein